MKSKENNFVSAVLYIHNHGQIIRPFLEALSGLLSENFKRHEIICVNDCSEDQSAAAVREFSQTAREGAVVLMSTGFYQGLESSLLAGVDFASGDFVFEFDSIAMDYDMALVMEVYHRCVSGWDIVGASSDANPSQTSRLFYSVFNKNAKTQYKIQTESFRILSRRAINRINQMNITIPYRKAIYAGCGLKYDNIPYSAKVSALPRQTENRAYRQGLAFDSLIIFTNVAYKVSFLFTLVMMGIAALSGLYTVIVFFMGKPIEGWTTTMILLAVGFFGVFGVLSIVIKYLSVIVDLVFKKAKYVIGNIEKL